MDKMTFLFTGDDNDWKNVLVFAKDHQVSVLPTHFTTVIRPKIGHSGKTEKLAAAGRNVRIYHGDKLVYQVSKFGLCFVPSQLILNAVAQKGRVTAESAFVASVPFGSIQAFDFMSKGLFSYQYTFILTDCGCVYKFEYLNKQSVVSSMVPDQMLKTYLFIDLICIGQQVVCTAYSQENMQTLYVLLDSQAEFVNRLTIPDEGMQC